MRPYVYQSSMTMDEHASKGLLVSLNCPCGLDPTVTRKVLEKNKLELLDHTWKEMYLVRPSSLRVSHLSVTRSLV